MNTQNQSPQAQPPSNQPPEDPTLARTSKWMIVGVWILLLAMLTWFGQRWFDRRANLNRDVSTFTQDGRKTVQLLANRNGHYIASGTINGEVVEFLLDTGATNVSIPQRVADKLELTSTDMHPVSTANGTVTVARVELSSVGLGELGRERVDGHINPHMPGEQVLLGMSFLRHFDLSQRANQLTIAEP